MSLNTPFHKETSTGFVTYEFPRGLKAIFEEKFGVRPTGQINIKMAELDEYVAPLFEGHPPSVQLVLAKKLLVALLEVDEDELGGFPPFRLAGMIREIALTAPNEFTAIRDEGAWKQGVPIPPPNLPPTENAPVAPPQVQPPQKLEQTVADQMAALQATIAQQQQQILALQRSTAGTNADNRASPMPSLRLAADAHCVSEWASDIEEDARTLIAHLEARFVAGLGHLSGGAILVDAFAALRLWILGVSFFQDWQQTPQKDLGNFLFKQLKIQYVFVTKNVPRKQLLEQLTKQDEEADPIYKAAVVVQQRQRAQPKLLQQRSAPSKPSWAKKGSAGNGQAGGQ